MNALRQWFEQQSRASRESMVTTLIVTAIAALVVLGYSRLLFGASP